MSPSPQTRSIRARFQVCFRLWRDHSLTIVLLTLGILVTAGAWLLEEGKGFDTVISVGTALLTGGVIFLFSGPFRERNRPEK
jgi:hypothetical protein